MLNKTNSKITANITSIGRYLPEKKLTNFDLEKHLDTSDQWIQDRTGIKVRRIANKNQATSDLCINAINELLEKRKKMDSDPDFKKFRELQKKGKQLEKDEKLEKKWAEHAKAREKYERDLEMEEAYKKRHIRERPESMDVAEEKFKEKEKEFRSPEFQEMLKLEK